MDAKVTENLKSWLENPYWKQYYEGAPTDLCKQFIAYEFYVSETLDESADRMMDELKPKLGAEDMRYLAKYAGNTPTKAELLRMAAQLEQ